MLYIKEKYEVEFLELKNDRNHLEPESLLLQPGASLIFWSKKREKKINQYFDHNQEKEN